jgi:transposase
MRTGRPKQPLMLTEEERERLQSLAHRSRSQPLLARRARVVLACADGLDNQAVAKKLRCSLGMVGKWRSRFLQLRLEGLYDEPRPGSPRKVSDVQDSAAVETVRWTANPCRPGRFTSTTATYLLAGALGLAAVTGRSLGA